MHSFRILLSRAFAAAYLLKPCWVLLHCIETFDKEANPLSFRPLYLSEFGLSTGTDPAMLRCQRMAIQSFHWKALQRSSYEGSVLRNGFDGRGGGRCFPAPPHGVQPRKSWPMMKQWRMRLAARMRCCRHCPVVESTYILTIRTQPRAYQDANP